MGYKQTYALALHNNIRDSVNIMKDVAWSVENMSLRKFVGIHEYDYLETSSLHTTDMWITITLIVLSYTERLFQRSSVLAGRCNCTAKFGYIFK